MATVSRAVRAKRSGFVAAKEFVVFLLLTESNLVYDHWAEHVDRFLGGGATRFADYHVIGYQKLRNTVCPTEDTDDFGCGFFGDRPQLALELGVATGRDSNVPVLWLDERGGGFEFLGAAGVCHKQHALLPAEFGFRRLGLLIAIGEGEVDGKSVNM